MTAILVSLRPTWKSGIPFVSTRPNLPVLLPLHRFPFIRLIFEARDIGTLLTELVVLALAHSGHAPLDFREIITDVYASLHRVVPDLDDLVA